MHHFESHRKSTLDSLNPDLPDCKAVLLHCSRLERDSESAIVRIWREVREDGKNLRENAELHGNENKID